MVADPSVLELRITGPGLDLVRRLETADEELLVGRDTGCAVCLPDPRRSISRRHLAVWNRGGELHFRVLSQVNGVQMPFGDAPPGAQGVLRAGERMVLADYVLSVTPPPARSVAEPQAADPWAVFDQQDGSGTVARPRTLVPPLPATAPAPALVPGAPPAAASSEDDPFGDWGFPSSFGPNGGEGGVVTELTPFFHGLGLPDAAAGPLADEELESMGRLVRQAIVGLLALHQAQAHPGAAGLEGAGPPNPLFGDEPAAAKLRYLFGGRPAQGAQLEPERALGQLLQHLGNYFTLASAGRDAGGEAATGPDRG